MTAALDGSWVRLRPDIGVVRQETETGAPAVLLHDPVAETFDKVEWPESDLVSLLQNPTDEAGLLAAFTNRTTLTPTLEDIRQYVRELEQRGLIERRPPGPARFRAVFRRGILRRLAGLLFFQVPIIYPAAFLQATAPLARLILNPLVAVLFMAFGVIGLVLALPRWAEFMRDSFGAFRADSIVFFVAAVVLSKTAHEFSHAYRATIAGARVKTMGIAFFFAVPFPFTDVTDAWRLGWRDRLRLATAGLWAELAVAAGALLLWSLAPPGDGKIAMARLSSVALLSTVLTNLNPGPRFDGYFILTCLLRTENLRTASLGLLRSAVYGRLFGLAVDRPDGDNRHRAGQFAYAVYAVFYRIALGCGLTVTAYHFLPKAFGVPAAAGIFLLFLALPVLGEGMYLWRRRSQMRITVWLVLLCFLLVATAVWFFGEWPRRVHFPAVTRAVREEAVRSRREGTVAEILAARGASVRSGDVLVRLTSEVDGPIRDIAAWSLREAELSEEQSYRGDDAYRREAVTRAAETARRREQVDALDERECLLDIVAPVSGRIVRWDDALAVGVPLGDNRVVGWIVSGEAAALSCYPEMADIGRLDSDEPVTFIPDSGGAPVPGRVVRIDRHRPEVLEDPALAPVLGAVAARGGAYILPTPYARVRVELDRPLDRVGQTGRVWATTRPESYARRTMQWLKNLAVRESAF
ncbi:MAG: efflux RND transporter periplasmic adaptor subunit [Planctomycetaceae bacterium]|nr:efflux RND transporter periplasmic adaptor subunit [Planctomycetaceae bacterium]